MVPEPRKFACAGLVAVAFAVSCATPADAALAWLAVRPTKEQRAAVIPAQVKARSIRGGATALCDVTEGRLTSCKVVHEEPVGVGFGDAVLSLAPLYQAPRLTPRVCEEVFNRAIISIGWPEDDVQPGWMRPPGATVLSAAFPKAAERQHVWGASALWCRTPAGGGPVKDCKVIYEEPVGWGFGEAAMAIAPMLKMTGAVSNGQAVESSVVVPIQYPFPHTCEVTRAWRHVRPQD